VTALRITKRTVDALQSDSRERTAWDDTISGFGVRVRPARFGGYSQAHCACTGRQTTRVHSISPPQPPLGCGGLLAALPALCSEAIADRTQVHN
jgi:hypothetical protein